MMIHHHQQAPIDQSIRDRYEHLAGVKVGYMRLQIILNLMFVHVTTHAIMITMPLVKLMAGIQSWV